MRKSRDLLSGNHALKRKPRVRLENICPVAQKEKRSELFSHIEDSLKRLSMWFMDILGRISRSQECRYPRETCGELSYLEQILMTFNGDRQYLTMFLTFLTMLYQQKPLSGWSKRDIPNSLIRRINWKHVLSLKSKKGLLLEQNRKTRKWNHKAQRIISETWNRMELSQVL